MLRTRQFLFLLLFISTSVFSQILRDTEKQSNVCILLGGAYSSFQAVDFSKVRYAGFGASVHLGYERNTLRNSISVTAGIRFLTEIPSTFDVIDERGLSRIIYPAVEARYMYNLFSRFAVGGRLDLLDFYYRSTRGHLLGNNELFIQNGYNLALSGSYQHQLNSKFKLSFLLDVGLLSYQRSSKSFAFAAPQVALEDGSFDYQNDALTNPFHLEYHKLRSGWQSIDIRTAVKLSYMQRWSAHYFWQFRSNSTVQGYPTTFGIHQLVVAYNIISNTRTKRKFRTELKDKK